MGRPQQVKPHQPGEPINGWEMIGRLCQRLLPTTAKNRPLGLLEGGMGCKSYRQHLHVCGAIRVGPFMGGMLARVTQNRGMLFQTFEAGWIGSGAGANLPLEGWGQLGR